MGFYADKKEELLEAYAHGEKVLADAVEMYEDASEMFDDALEMYKKLSKVYKELSEAYKELADSYKELAGVYKEATAKSKAEIARLQIENKARRDLLAEIMQKEELSSELRGKIETLLNRQEEQGA